MSFKKISICIPTYNRSSYLNEAIASIISCFDGVDRDDVEICISDNASTDDTKLMIYSWIKRSPIEIKYSVCTENKGADANYLRVVEMASGEYCWLFGSDDQLTPGAGKKIIAEIGSGEDIYLCNRVECNISMQPLRQRYWLGAGIPSTSFDFSNKSEVRSYFEKAESVGAIFSYLTSIVFRRDKWNKVIVNTEYIGTAYVHVYMLLSILRKSGRLRYVNDPLILCRGENDSFATEGVVKRAAIDLDGYAKLGKDFFGQNSLYDEFMGVLKRERPEFATLVAIRIRSDRKQWNEFVPKFRAVGYSRIAILFVGKIKVPLLILKSVRSYYREAAQCFQE